jgi:putative ABC transport system ATP-binding protein
MTRQEQGRCNRQGGAMGWRQALPERVDRARPGGIPRLEGQHLTRSYGKGKRAVTAVQDVSLELHGGEVTLLMGPSGSGKSTLLAILAGLLPPDGGKVLALGQDLWALSEAAREEFRLRHCGFVFQGFNLFPELKAREQLEIVLRWGEGMSRGEARHRSEELLTRLGLGDRLGLRPAELSGGEQQRVAIGRALVKEPSLCFVDEPTSALAWHQGEQVARLLSDAARRRQATILIVSHDDRLLPFADQVLYLEDGVLGAAPPSIPERQPGGTS